MATYQVTVQETAEPSKGFSFDFDSHEDLFEILERARRKDQLSEEEVKQFCLGLKLFSGVLLAHREEQPFAALMPAFGTFMRALKGHGGASPLLPF